MKKLLTCLLALATLYSCKKGGGGQNAAELLSAHTWYPYESQIRGADTLTVTTYDSLGKPHSVTSFHTFDTTYVLDSCMQQSRFRFASNGSLTISNPCGAQPSLDTTWSLTHNTVLAAAWIVDPASFDYVQKLVPWVPFSPQDSAYSYTSSIGAITSINHTAFTYNNNIVEASIDRGSMDQQGHYVDSLDKKSFRQYLTFRAQ